MNKKLVIFLIFVLFFTTNIFAERKTRVDEYGHATTKIIWNDTKSGGPDDSNWAQTLYENTKGWSSVLVYHFLLGYPHNYREYRTYLYTSKSDGYYKVVWWCFNDGLWEKLYANTFWNYNSARLAFDDLCLSIEPYL